MRLNVRGLFLLAIFIIALLKSGDLAFSNPIPGEVNFIYNGHGKRDPFWSLLGHRGTVINYDNDIQASDMALEGILVEPTGGSVAIINGNIVKVGEKVGFFIVKAIAVNAVILEKGQEIITLKLKKEE